MPFSGNPDMQVRKLEVLPKIGVQTGKTKHPNKPTLNSLKVSSRISKLFVMLQTKGCAIHVPELCLYRA